MTYEEVTQELEGLSGWGRAAFAAACAERVSPLALRLNQPQVASLFRAALESAFDKLAGRAGDGAAESAAAAVEDFLEENATDDSDSPLFQAVEALSVLGYAFSALTAEDDPRPAKWASSGAMDIASGVDYVLGDDWPRPVMIDPRNPPPPGPLEARETRAQQETLELLKSAPRPAAELLGALRDLSREASRELDLGLVEFCRRMGWECDPAR